MLSATEAKKLSAENLQMIIERERKACAYEVSIRLKEAVERGKRHVSVITRYRELETVKLVIKELVKCGFKVTTDIRREYPHAVIFRGAIICCDTITVSW